MSVKYTRNFVPCMLKYLTSATFACSTSHEKAQKSGTLLSPFMKANSYRAQEGALIPFAHSYMLILVRIHLLEQQKRLMFCDFQFPLLYQHCPSPYAKVCSTLLIYLTMFLI